jgi:hypothetical protein
VSLKVIEDRCKGRITLPSPPQRPYFGSDGTQVTFWQVGDPWTKPLQERIVEIQAYYTKCREFELAAPRLAAAAAEKAAVAAQKAAAANSEATSALRVAEEKIKADTLNSVVECGFTWAEAEAVIAHIIPLKLSKLEMLSRIPRGDPRYVITANAQKQALKIHNYTPNTLLALQAFNRFATTKSIRVEDAITVLSEKIN